MKYIKIDEKYKFSEELLTKVKTLAEQETKNKDEVKSTLKELNVEYKKLNSDLKAEVKKTIEDIRKSYKEKEKVAVEEHKKALEEAAKMPKGTKEEQKQYREIVSGINIKKKRYLKTLVKDRIQDEIDAKRAITLLRIEYTNHYEEAKGKSSFFVSFVTEKIDARNSTTIEKIVRDREFWLSKISIFTFLVLVLFYAIICMIGGLKIEYEKIIEASSVVVAVALGGVFIYSMKSFDMSLGGGTALAAVIGAMLWQQTHSIIVVLLVAIAIGIVIEVINSILASMLKLPVMVTTLAMSSVLGAIVTKILDGTATHTVKVTKIRQLDEFWFYLVLILVLFAITAFIFKYTPVGRRNKMIGANQKSSKFTGINITKQGLITFIIAGIAIGFGATLYIVNSRTVSSESCGTIGLDVILAIVFGGMQTTGGPKSKISAAITGGLTATLISYILIALGLVVGNDAITQSESFVKGFLFLVIVTVNTIGNRNKRLPGIELMW